MLRAFTLGCKIPEKPPVAQGKVASFDGSRFGKVKKVTTAGCKVSMNSGETSNTKVSQIVGPRRMACWCLEPTR